MLRIASDSSADQARARQILSDIESKLGERVYCLYQNMGVDSPEEQIFWHVVSEARTKLQKVGHLEKLTVLLESPGGNADYAYRLVRTFRRYVDRLNVIVVSWAKSAATIFSLGADKIFLSDDGELGPLDSQINDPDGGRSLSALNAFKSLEFLREHALDASELVVRMYVEGYKMHLPNAIRHSKPLVSDMVQPLFNQLDPLPLGEARRYLQVGEEYSKLIMERYSYKHLSKQAIEKIVHNLVWEYPSHGFVIDLELAQKIGLSVARLDDEVSELCEQLLATVPGCVGIIDRSPAASPVAAASHGVAVATPASSPTTVVSTEPNGSGKEEKDEVQV